MDERALQFRVGFMVLAALISAAILAAIFGNLPSLGLGSKTIDVRFPEAPGATVGTPVRKSGILIGRVTGIRFA
jgi:ABC-type transporter Mla subunit MlaD